ncbi:helix-turn-helix transcriptional regulator [Lacticaseibacillus paracasei subsp. tolerans]|uniref:helix-turn-helix transcriptional regulator n=1 Tax=Lacticaseibacillus paracasei TaxID=1597 RepID=UPI0018AD5BAE|nr:helix-turn-helix transcriptional regulator [Lacticaseibacillus paracasei]QPI89304.1 helix-turn-helix transcriptional regulator [Lacticaseibacillus paracasei subsp. tolerans]
MELKRARERSGLTQEELAVKAGLSIAMVQSLEAGRRNGSTKTALKLSEVLNTSIDELLHGNINTNSTSPSENSVQKEAAK